MHIDAGELRFSTYLFNDQVIGNGIIKTQLNRGAQFTGWKKSEVNGLTCLGNYTDPLQIFQAIT